MSTTVPPPADGGTRRTRERLRPDARIALILDAALQEFSARGYEATRVDDIARRAGLSKGGLYAHFQSKRDIFGALLEHVLIRPVLDVQTLLQGAQTSTGWLPALVESFYASVQDARTLATIRLVLAEGHRVSDQVATWRRDSLEGLLAEIGAMLREAAAQGRCKDSVVTRHPWLILAPLVYAAMRQIEAGAPVEPSFDQARTVHVEMLRELLEPAPASVAGGDASFRHPSR